MWKTRAHFLARLEGRGFEELGNGLFASVWGKPGSPKVVKVGPVDDGWPAYIGWAKRNGWLGKMAPDVTSFRVIKPEKGGAFYVAVMERLGDTVADYARDHGGRSKIMRTWTTLKPEKYRNAFGEIEDLEDKLPDWAPFVKGLEGFVSRHSKDVRFDTHDENWMVTEDGKRLVLTDPLAPKGGYYGHKERGRGLGELTVKAASAFAPKSRKGKQLSLAI